MIIASRLGPAQALGITWKGAGAWLIVSQSRQENFSRTVSITFHRRGVVSSVCVTSSPSLRRRLPPQHAQVVGGSITTRSRGKWSGNVSRSARRRVKGRTVVVFAAACSAANSSSVALAANSSNSSANWSISRTDRSDLCP
jgi:hypothetical protein